MFAKHLYLSGLKNVICASTPIIVTTLDLKVENNYHVIVLQIISRSVFF